MAKNVKIMVQKLSIILLLVLLGGVSAYSFRTYSQVGDTLVFNNDQFRGEFKGSVVKSMRSRSVER